MRTHHRRYLRDFVLAMTAYVCVLITSIWTLRHVDSNALRAALALAPAVPVVAVARAILHFVHASDELDQKILLEAFSLAALALTLGSFSLGLLVTAQVVSIGAGTALLWILPTYCFLYGMFVALARWRYR